MLAKTQDLEVRDSEAAAFRESSEPFICALARLYCRRLLEAVRRAPAGVRRARELLPVIRGKVDWPSQARLQATAPRVQLPLRRAFGGHANEPDPEGRAPRRREHARGSSGRRAPSPSSGTCSNGVSDSCPSREVVRRLRTDRMSRRLEPLLALAKLILGGPEPGPRPRIHWRPKHLRRRLGHERPLRGVRGARLPGSVRAEGPRRGPPGDRLRATSPRRPPRKRKAFVLKPDILVREGRAPVAVADTKWKRLDPTRQTSGVSGAGRVPGARVRAPYATDSAVLVYPHHPALGPPGPQLEFLTHGPSFPPQSCGW